mgnify:FL=1
MERLTKRIKRLQKDDLIVYTKGIYEGAIPAEMTNDDIREALKKLAAYEDLEEQCLLVRLPVKIGDDIYKIPSKVNYDLNVLNGYNANNRVYHQKVYSIVFSQRGWLVQCDKDSIYAPNVICVDVEYGETWFTTREEAEKKLKERN